MARIAVALMALVAVMVTIPAVVIAQEYTYTVKFDAYAATTCDGSAAQTSTYANGTACANLFSTYYSDVSCDENGSPSGKACQNDCTCGTQLTIPDGTVWGQKVCFGGSAPALSVTCQRQLVPPAEPVAASPTETSTPTESSTPATGEAPTGSGEVPEDHTPVGLIGEGTVQFLLYFGNNCPSTPQTINLNSDISQCQSNSDFGETFYFKADCFTNSSSYGFFCNADDTCTDCTAIPSAPSNTCVNVELSFIKSVKFICPAVPVPDDGTAGPTPSPSPSPVSPPTGTTPSGEASSLKVLYAFIYIVAAMAAILML